MCELSLLDEPVLNFIPGETYSIVIKMTNPFLFDYFSDLV